jgi:hypothetical protein
MGHQYRVIHVGTGYTGSIVLRQILRSSRLKLVGHLVHSPDKVGTDSAELVDQPAVGVVATDNLEDLLALDADCVTYCAAVSGREGGEVIGQISALLASGKNVVTPSYHALFTRPLLTMPQGNSWKRHVGKGTVPYWPQVSRRASPPTFLPCTRQV